MASIQQSMNALSSALAGVATAGSYMYRQSDKYKSGQLSQRANKLQKIYESGVSENAPDPSAKDLETAELITKTREEAFALNPSLKRREAVWKAYGQETEAGEIHQENLDFDEAQRAEAEAEDQRYIEMAEEDERILAERSREQAEAERASQATRDLILQDQRLVAVNRRTAEYQNQLMEIRKQLKGGSV